MPLQFMLLTNITVGQQIAVHLPEQALLRRHDTPLERRLVRSQLRCRTTVLMSNSRTTSVSVLNAWDTRWMRLLREVL